MCRKGVMMVTFGKTKECLTQYSGVDNSVQALCLAEEALKEAKGYKAGGQAYFIVDGGPPVDTFQFWRPLMEAMGTDYPQWRLPYSLMYFFAFLMECFYHLTGVEPILTRLEVNLVGVTNYYSIEKARRDLGYRPTRNHDLSSSVAYFKKFYADQSSDSAAGDARSKRSMDPKTFILLVVVGAVFLWFVLDFVIE